MKPANVEVRIDELVLHGFEPSGRERIGETVKHELTRLFTKQGAPPSLAHERRVARLDGGAFEARLGLRAEAIGVHVARALYEGLSA